MRELEAAPLAGVEAWLGNLLAVDGDPLFRAYEVAFFGFGRPSRLEPVSMIRHGEVQVSVALDPAHMNAFKAHINNSMPRSHYRLYTTHFLVSLVRLTRPPGAMDLVDMLWTAT